MTKEEILRSFSIDDSFATMTGLSPDQIETIKFSEKSSSKLVEVIKLAIDGVLNGESESLSSRKINTLLNK